MPLNRFRNGVRFPVSCREVATQAVAQLVTTPLGFPAADPAREHDANLCFRSKWDFGPIFATAGTAAVMEAHNPERGHRPSDSRSVATFVARSTLASSFQSANTGVIMAGGAYQQFNPNGLPCSMILATSPTEPTCTTARTALGGYRLRVLQLGVIQQSRFDSRGPDESGSVGEATAIVRRK
jgi:hypothetical protein